MKPMPDAAARIARSASSRDGDGGAKSGAMSIKGMESGSACMGASYGAGGRGQFTFCRSRTTLETLLPFRGKK
jgi:hypothetical protein